MTFQHLRLEISDQIGTIMLDRPEKLNALSRDLHNEMVAAASQLQADDDVRVVIVTGAGRGFCSGADLTARPKDSAPDTQNDRMDEFGWVGQPGACHRTPGQAHDRRGQRRRRRRRHELGALLRPARRLREITIPRSSSSSARSAPTPA